MDGWEGVGTDKWMGGQVGDGSMDKWENKQMDGWMDGWMGEELDGQTDGWIDRERL